MSEAAAIPTNVADLANLQSQIDGPRINEEHGRTMADRRKSRGNQSEHGYLVEVLEAHGERINALVRARYEALAAAFRSCAEPTAPYQAAIITDLTELAVIARDSGIAEMDRLARGMNVGWDGAVMNAMEQLKRLAAQAPAEFAHRLKLLAKEEERDARAIRLLLEPEQEQLLLDLVMQSRSVPRDEDGGFYFSHALDPDPRAYVEHVGKSGLGPTFRVHLSDLESLAKENLLHIRFEDGHRTGSFYVTPRGVEYYGILRRLQGEPIQRVQGMTIELLRSGSFREDFRNAYATWARAEALVGGELSDQDLTTIGHHCREAMMYFAGELLARLNVACTLEPQKTLERIRLALGTIPSEQIRAFIDALVVYWGTVSDLAQRQEHGAAKEGQKLSGEDARRLVFHTAIIMVELDRATRL